IIMMLSVEINQESLTDRRRLHSHTFFYAIPDQRSEITWKKSKNHNKIPKQKRRSRGFIRGSVWLNQNSSEIKKAFLLLSLSQFFCKLFGIACTRRRSPRTSVL